MTSSISASHLKIVSEVFSKTTRKEATTITEICDQTKLSENIVLEALNLFKQHRLLIQSNDLWKFNNLMIFTFCKVIESETSIQRFIDNPERETSPMRLFYDYLNSISHTNDYIYERTIINENLSPKRIDLLLSLLEKEQTIQREPGRFIILKPERLKDLENDFNQRTDEELRNNKGLHEQFRQEDIQEALSPAGPPPPRSSLIFNAPKFEHPLPKPSASLSFNVDSDECIRSMKRIGRMLTDKRRKEKTLHIRVSTKMALEFEQLCNRRDLSISEATRLLIKGFINNQNKASS